MDTKNIKDFPEILQINENTRLLAIGNNNIGDGAKITVNRLMSQSISPSENNILQLDDNNKLYVPKSGEIVFNNPFAFGDFKYSDHVISNLSWVLSDGQRKSGTFYEQYYNWLLSIYNGTTTVAGISVKLVNDSSATDYDYKIDTNSREFILPIETRLHPIDSSNNIPVVGNGMTLGLNDGTNNCGLRNINYYCTSLKSIYGTSIGTSASGNSDTVNTVSIGVTPDPTKSGIEAKLSSAKATAYLYYFVGDVIQGANVIDVVKLEEQVTEVSNNVTSLSERIYIKDTYVNGTSGYRIWSDGYCEQWGKSNTVETIYLIRKYDNTNYNISFAVYGTLIEKNSPVITSVKTDRFTYQADLRMFIYWKTSGYLPEGSY